MEEEEEKEVINCLDQGHREEKARRVKHLRKVRSRVESSLEAESQVRSPEV